MRGTKVTFDTGKLHYSSELMRALAHPLRLKILEFIDDHKSINVNKIYSNLDLEQSITSQHLKILRMSGVVSVEVTGKFHIYQINYDVINKASFAVNRFVGKAQSNLTSNNKDKLAVIISFYDCFFSLRYPTQTGSLFWETLYLCNRATDYINRNAHLDSSLFLFRYLLQAPDFGIENYSSH